jgi:hypothetical protein
MALGAVKFVVFDACRNELQLPSRDTSKGLVPVAEQQGFFVAYASAPGRTATDRGEGSGPYAAALAKELGRQGLDHLNLFQNVKEAVIASTGGTQHPWESNGLTRRVYLTGEPTMPADIALWESVRTTNDPAALQRYVDRFPKGVFAATAHQMMERLKSEEAQHEAARQFEIERKAQEAKQIAELQKALEEARAAREALTLADQQRTAAAAREAELRQTLEAANASTKGDDQSAPGRGAMAELAQRAQIAAEEARATRDALASAEAKRQDAEKRLAALEKAEQDRRPAGAAPQKVQGSAGTSDPSKVAAVTMPKIEPRSEGAIRVYGFANFDLQCRPRHDMPIDVLKKPRFGTISFRIDESTISTVSSKDRQHCVGTRQLTRTAYYVVDEKYRDLAEIDTVVIRVTYGQNTFVNEFEIDLRKGTASRTKVTRQ